MYLDSFLKNAKLEGKDITDALHQLKDISEAYKINFVLSDSIDKENYLLNFRMISSLPCKTVADEKRVACWRPSFHVLRE